MFGKRIRCRGVLAAMAGSLLLGGCLTAEAGGAGGPAVRPVYVVRGSGARTGTVVVPPAELAARAPGHGVQVVRGRWIDVPKSPPSVRGRPNPFGSGLDLPLDGATLSSGYGVREHPILGGVRMHSGIDLAAPSGTPIRAAADGVIEEAGPNGGYGNYVRIAHAGGVATAYGHMSRHADGIRTGTRVRQGEVIGYVGSTGLSTGPHLHYEVLRDGDQVDPMPFLPPGAARTMLAEAGPNPPRGSGP